MLKMSKWGNRIGLNFVTRHPTSLLYNREHHLVQTTTETTESEIK